MQSSHLNQSLKESSLIEKVLMETVKEQRRKRRWGIFFKLGYLAAIISLVWVLKPQQTLVKHNKMHTSVVAIEGPIMADNHNNAEEIIESLKAAFNDPKTKGVIIHLNSPGGSPVQADTIYQTIRHLEKKHPKLPVIALCSDICASGAYYIAAAAQQIYANPSSIVGSIGVKMDSFGFVETLHKLGITRRLITAGDNKDFMDPFMPLNEKDLQYTQTMLNQIHQQFISAVTEGRGKRLKKTPELFSGLAWTGIGAKKLGLIDGFSTLDSLAQDLIKAEEIIDYSVQTNLFNMIINNLSNEFSHKFLSHLPWLSSIH